jgi:hypothetical protein
MALLPRLLTWLMLVFLVGGHWGMLQVVAWTGMVITYSRDASFGEAVRMTFDGEHPCQLCHEVRAGLAGGGDQAPAGKIPDKSPLKIAKSLKTFGLPAVIVLEQPEPDVLGRLAMAEPGAFREADVAPLRRPPRLQG